MNKRALIPLLLAGGIATGIGLSTMMVAQGEADAQPIVADANPGSGAELAPDASITHAPEGKNLPSIPDLSDDIPGFLLASYRWIMAGGWLAMVPFLIAVIWLARHPKMWPLSKFTKFQAFIHSGARGPAILSLTIAIAGMGLHTILATGGAPSLAALKVALLTGGLAAGAYSLLKAIIWNK